MNEEPQALTGEALEHNLTHESRFPTNPLAMILFIPSPQHKTKQFVARGVRHKVELSWMHGDEKLQIPERGGRGSPWRAGRWRAQETPKVRHVPCP